MMTVIQGIIYACIAPVLVGVIYAAIGKPPKDGRILYGILCCVVLELMYLAYPF